MSLLQWLGDGEWTGDWSDGSPLWSERPEVKAALDAIRADASLARRPFDDRRENDGIFFMSLVDLCSVYNQATWGIWATWDMGTQ